jgi:carbonic anhydrase/acetyltransferase-like protein (isoleucine patch superfamily)
MSGRAIILRTETVLSPFGDHVSETFFSGETLVETQDRALSRLGFEVVRANDAEAATRAIQDARGAPCLLLLDRVYISEKAAKDFLSAAKKSPRPSALALTINASVEYTLPLQDILREGELVVHDVLLVDANSLPAPEPEAIAWLRKIRDQATRVAVPKREIVVEVPLPIIGERRQMLRYPVTSTIVVSIESWVHVLWLNQIAFGIRWMELIRRRPLWAIFRAISALSIDRDRLLMRLVWRGKRTRIHPTASLSGAIIGDGAQIGAHVTVRNSIVGKDAVLEDHSVLLNTVVGPRCLVTENSFLVSTVSYPDATIGNYKLQVSLIGRGAYVHAWAGFIDAKFVGHVNVAHKGQLVSTERAFIGSVVGHRAKVAAKVLIHPGREIPNDTTIVMRPDEVVSVVPADLPRDRPLVRDRGTLVPLGEES